MSSKNISLPKIKEGAHHSPKKVLKEFHKVKWSIAPRCLVEGHQSKQVMYICINPACEETTRLVCQVCFFKNHQKHNEQFLAIDEIKIGQIDKLRYWPFQKKYRKIFEFVTKHESYISNMIQDVNATFNGMAMRIISSIDKIRLNLLKKIDSFYLKQTVKQEFCDKVKVDLQECFELKRIQETVRQIFTKQIRHDIFLERMNKLLNDSQVKRCRDSLIEYFDKAEKGKDMAFDKMRFLKKENWIIEQIQEQKKTLKETDVIIDDEEMGIQKILPQTIAYLDKCAEGYYPLTFEKKVIEDGSEYTGFLSRGIRTMFGMRRYKSGYVYYGQWKINARNGWGVYQNKSIGYKYAGSWKEDRKNGYGREESVVSIYEGNFVADRKEGFGVLMEDGIRYQITWKNDKKHGQGKKIEKDGTQTQIYYLNGIESVAKQSKISPAFDLQQLTKRFSAKSNVTGLSAN